VNEKELLFRISHIANQSGSFEDAVEKIGDLMEQELGGKGLIVRELEDDVPGGIAASAETFFEETAHLPSRALYTVALRANGQELGRLIAFFACAESSDGIRQRVANFAGEQLGIMLERLRLARRRRELRAEISRTKTNLATRKALQRAEGILGRRGLDPETAHSWLKREAAKRGLTLVEVASRLFDQEMTHVEEPRSVPVRSVPVRLSA
jgi:GAF domain-containing protein